jgi:hypothetical protein
VQVHHDGGVANRIDPESCAVATVPGPRVGGGRSRRRQPRTSRQAVMVGGYGAGYPERPSIDLMQDAE